jgi:hypothetical protein
VSVREVPVEVRRTFCPCDTKCASRQREEAVIQRALTNAQRLTPPFQESVSLPMLDHTSRALSLTPIRNTSSVSPVRDRVVAHITDNTAKEKAQYLRHIRSVVNQCSNGKVCVVVSGAPFPLK